MWQLHVMFNKALKNLWNVLLFNGARDRGIKLNFWGGQNQIKTTTGLRDDDYFICIYIGHTLPIMIDVMFSNMELWWNLETADRGNQWAVIILFPLLSLDLSPIHEVWVELYQRVTPPPKKKKTFLIFHSIHFNTLDCKKTENCGGMCWKCIFNLLVYPVFHSVLDAIPPAFQCMALVWLHLSLFTSTIASNANASDSDESALLLLQLFVESEQSLCCKVKTTKAPLYFYYFYNYICFYLPPI